MKVAEECAEITKVASKTSQFGWDSTNPFIKDDKTNREKLQMEVNDLLAILDLLNESGEFYLYQDPEYIKERKDKCRKYYNKSVDSGYVSLGEEL